MATTILTIALVAPAIAGMIATVAIQWRHSPQGETPTTGVRG